MERGTCSGTNICLSICLSNARIWAFAEVAFSICSHKCSNSEIKYHDRFINLLSFPDITQKIRDFRQDFLHLTLEQFKFTLGLLGKVPQFWLLIGSINNCRIGDAFGAALVSSTKNTSCALPWLQSCSSNLPSLPTFSSTAPKLAPLTINL